MYLPWQDISYLQSGNERQRRAYRALQDLKVFEILSDYQATLVGTIPIRIDVEDSDLDVVCCVRNAAKFTQLVTTAFGALEAYRIKEKRVKEVPSVVAGFFHAGFRVEIFGQPREVEEQHAYRHMIVEHRLLTIGGQAAQDEIQSLKRAGMKTEPAFAHYFGLSGDPYERLLELSWLTVEQLEAVVKLKG